jgi:hypothetical protein
MGMGGERCRIGQVDGAGRIVAHSWRTVGGADGNACCTIRFGIGCSSRAVSRNDSSATPDVTGLGGCVQRFTHGIGRPSGRYRELLSEVQGSDMRVETEGDTVYTLVHHPLLRSLASRRARISGRYEDRWFGCCSSTYFCMMAWMTMSWTSRVRERRCASAMLSNTGI